MQTTPLLPHPMAANLRYTREPLSRRIELRESLRAPQREVGEWTPRGTGIDVGRIAVSPYQSPTISARMSDPNSLVGQLEHSEDWPESCGEVCQTGRRPIGTYGTVSVIVTDKAINTTHMPSTFSASMSMTSSLSSSLQLRIFLSEWTRNMIYSIISSFCPLSS